MEYELSRAQPRDPVEVVRGVYDASYARLVGQLTTVTGSQAEAEDLVMEAFARALGQGRTFVDVANPEAWLRTVAVNQARSRFRRQALWRTLLPRLAPTPDQPYADLPADQVALMAALATLPYAQREAIALHHLADLSVAEVAATVDAPVGTVKARLARGRAALAVLLKEDHDD